VDDLERRFRRLADQRLPTSPPPLARLRSRGRRRVAGGVAGLAVLVAVAAVTLRSPEPGVRFAEDAPVPATPAPPSTQDPSPAPEAAVVAPPNGTPSPAAAPAGPRTPAPAPSSPAPPPQPRPGAGPDAPGAVATPGDPPPPDLVVPAQPSPERPAPEVWEGTFAYEEVQEEDEGRRTVVRHLLVLSPRGDGTYTGRYDVSGDVEPYAADVTGVVEGDVLLVRRGTPTDAVLFALLPPPAPDRGPLTRWGAVGPVLDPAPPGPTYAFVRVG